MVAWQGVLALALLLAFTPPEGPRPQTPRLDTQVLVANNVYSLGSQNQNWYATLLTARLSAGIPAVSGMLHAAVGAPFRVRGSAARSDTGHIFDLGLGVRSSPLQHRVFRLGVWLLWGMERQARHSSVELMQPDTVTYRQRRVAWHTGPELGLELGAMIPSRALAERNLRLGITAGASLRLAFPIGITRSVTAPDGSVETIRPDPTSLALIGPLGGATVAVLLGATLEWDIQRPSSRPSSRSSASSTP